MNFIPVQTEIHKNSRWKRPTNFDFAARDLTCLTTVSEARAVLRYYPLAFTQMGGSYRLIIVLGLEGKQRNLFVSADGRWVGEAIPVIYRCHPFQLLSPSDDEGSEDKKMLCIEEGSQTKCCDSDQPFFEADGELADLVRSISTELTEYNRNLIRTDNACEALVQLDLIKPWKPSLVAADKKYVVEGLYGIDEQRLKEISAEELKNLSQSEALSLAYMQLFSIINFRRFPSILAAHEKVAAIAKKDLIDITLNTETDGGTLNLDNI